jgi:membrane-associated HD superfamily phosphohydrolase
VTHGAELARKNGLPPVVIDFIWQHHGTSRVEFFYRQAQKFDRDDTTIEDDSVFRYPGPKPQSKETALVMLADVVESATRTLESPTPDRIRAFVARLVNRVFEEDQLDRSPLTMKDLSTAIDAFSDVLVGMYHHRIDYPLGLKPGERQPPPGEIVPAESRSSV